MLNQPCRERICLCGASGVGKTHAYLSIARLLENFSAPGTFTVISTDGGADRALGCEFSEIAHRVNIIEAWDFRECCAALQSARKTATRADWIVVDLCTIWDLAQDDYCNRVFGHDLVELMVASRAQFEAQRSALSKKQGAPALDPMRDWGAIKKMHGDFIADLLLRNKSNVLAAVKSKPLSVQYDSNAILTEYQRFGERPDAKSDLIYAFDTVLFLSAAGNPAERRIRTYKDRSRPVMDEIYDDFATSYLLGNAGWRME